MPKYANNVQQDRRSCHERCTAVARVAKLDIRTRCTYAVASHIAHSSQSDVRGSSRGAALVGYFTAARQHVTGCAHRASSKRTRHRIRSLLLSNCQAPGTNGKRWRRRQAKPASSHDGASRSSRA
ncbi:hypothetical protein HBI56_163440 [Parastagonospora nodorum]|uniref:Uncharacterized protein n=1 Tax=Phaeosphaeria nodorum (strain SN15 / ATCC MYA-4574 / FGSC 10173) TaxID=321614 RepID=A0A7U2I9P6_PHANO|nr:hypothetical protein HBH56_125720 [Parastagonospora nodorum]QRD05845.1 hypothetical protein JI435_132770 [Parastagonospora nodorum SN15]KAH3931387.1 hypothetical protein HBH54_097790 [Parastagonospora nodorum]KAH3944406.1 hypothetical protein HBH53_159270 [Parastagonospora nodorum]KAH3956867.1 hypothetical protein HBH51_234030 [Parastagonospora nodorum]